MKIFYSSTTLIVLLMMVVSVPFVMADSDRGRRYDKYDDHDNMMNRYDDNACYDDEYYGMDDDDYYGMMDMDDDDYDGMMDMDGRYGNMCYDNDYDDYNDYNDYNDYDDYDDDDS